MKNVTWMELAIAMPMVLTLSTVGGKLIVIAAAVVMTLGMALIKWGRTFWEKESRIINLCWLKLNRGTDKRSSG